MLPHIKWSRCLLIIFFAALLVSNVNVSFSQSSSKLDNAYVVIGAFSIERNAQRLVDYAREKEITVEYKIHPTKELYYVFEEVEDPLTERRRIKENFPEFYDVWVYEGVLGRDLSNQPASQKVVATSKGTTQGSQEVINVTRSVVDGNSGEMRSSGASDLELDAANEEQAVSRASEETTGPITIEPKENTYYLYLNTYNAKNLKEVKGKVNVIDPVRAKQLKEAKSHTIEEIRDPNNGSKSVKLATNIFGFKEVQQSIILDNPVNDTTSSFVHTIGDSIIVDFELQRYKKGDVLVMYNVYFFIDAAIMKPESIYELNSLLDMLQENENLVVKLHGHTNGNSHGKILHLDLDDKNFFSLNANHKEDAGSAKKLSEYRAYTIQHWLMEQGIDEERIDIKGWGGKKMLFDKLDNQAFKNVRVEVEILEE